MLSRLRRSESGLTLVELMVAMFILSIMSASFYSVMFNSADTADKTTAVTQASEEVRRGFNRLLRDTREAQDIIDPTESSFSIEVDFDGDGSIEPTPSDASGNYERLRFIFVEQPDGLGTIEVTNGFAVEVLMEGVDCLRDTFNACYPLFDFMSNNLFYDADRDGVTTWQELDLAPSIGNGNNVIDGDEVRFIDMVAFGMRVTVDGRSEDFYGTAQLRNSR